MMGSENVAGLTVWGLRAFYALVSMLYICVGIIFVLALGVAPSMSSSQSYNTTYTPNYLTPTTVRTNQLDPQSAQVISIFVMLFLGLFVVAFIFAFITTFVKAKWAWIVNIIAMIIMIPFGGILASLPAGLLLVGLFSKETKSYFNAG